MSHLPSDELLYTGTKSITLTDTPTDTTHTQAVGEAKVAFIAPPNNNLFGSSRYRTPLPLGLWAYNAFSNDSTGLRHWLFRTFATQPIYISMVNPALRAKVAENTLHNYGYFDSQVSYRVDTLSDGKRASLSYALTLGKAWHYGKIEYNGFPQTMDSLIRATWTNRLLREGHPLSYATLNGERNRLFTLFREQGYYHFRPEMIILLADTASVRGKANLHITLPTNLPPHATKSWRVGHTYLTIRRTPDEQPTDTLLLDNISYLYRGSRIPIRQPILTSRIAYRHGDLYSSASQNATQRDLYRLGILRGASINYTPRADDARCDTLDVHITTLLEPPYDLSLEAHLTTKSNNQIGPSLTASLSRKNLLRMAETLQLRLKGSYEWQTHRSLRHESATNSFSLGAKLTMSAPQLLFPGGYDHHYEHPVATTANLYTDWIHRGGYFRVLAFGGDLAYTFSTSPTLTHNVTPLSLTFNTLEHATELFDSLMAANPAIELSFRDQFVPQSRYTLTYNEVNLPHPPTHPSRVTATLASAGALVSLVYATLGHPLDEKGKSLMHSPYAQYLKGHVEACRYYHIAPRHTLATRLFVGLLYAYGNSTLGPFSELFSVGGAHDLRAFPLRSIGPGSYHTTSSHAYTDHVGDIKLGANVEWRFPIVQQLGGALFVDAGNIWTLRHDSSRPGSQLRLKTLPSDIALGTGLGLRYNLRVLLLRADIGIPLHTPYATTRHGYYNIPHFARALCFHLGIGQAF